MYTSWSYRGVERSTAGWGGDEVSIPRMIG
jgi:hypothetical protein